MSSGRLSLVPGQTQLGAFQHPLSPGVILAKHMLPELAFVLTRGLIEAAGTCGITW